MGFGQLIRLPLSVRTRIRLIGECWEFTGACNDQGYPQINYQGKLQAAHRLVYKLLVGPIPVGKELDHKCHTLDTNCLGGKTCRHRRCLNPAHLEPVTHRENTLRGRTVAAFHAQQITCVKGHLLQRLPSGYRGCPICIRARSQSRRARLGKDTGPTTDNLKTHCKRGHELTADNLYIGYGGRQCRRCSVEGEQARRLAKGAQYRFSSLYCKNEHLLSPDNVYILGGKARVCKICTKAASKARHQQLKDKR